MKTPPLASLIILIALFCAGCGARPAPGLSAERMAATKKAAVVSLLTDELRIDDQSARDIAVSSRAVEGWSFREVTEDPVQRLLHTRPGVEIIDSASVRPELAAAFAQVSGSPAYDREPLVSAIKRLQSERGIDTLLLIRADAQRPPDGTRPVSGAGLLRARPDSVMVYGALAVDVVDAASCRRLASGRGYRSAPFGAEHWAMCAQGEGPDSIAGLRAQSRDVLEAAAAEAMRTLGFAAR